MECGCGALHKREGCKDAPMKAPPAAGPPGRDGRAGTHALSLARSTAVAAAPKPALRHPHAMFWVDKWQAAIALGIESWKPLGK